MSEHNQQGKVRIVVVGSSNTDMIVRTHTLPAPGETVIGGTFMTAAGGKGANQAVAAARLGAEVSLIACCGDDDLGRAVTQGFMKDGIDTTDIRVEKEVSSGVALIMVDEKGQNSIAVASGANLHLTPEDIRHSEKKIASADYVLVQLEIPLETVEAVVEIAGRNGTNVILNPAPAQKLHDGILNGLDVITPNEAETEQLLGVSVDDMEGIERAGNILLDKGVRVAVITLGRRGAYVATRNEKMLVDAHDVDAVDATAAGDVFNGALAVALSEGLSPVDAVRYSCAASAISVTRPGAQPSAPNRNEVRHFLEAQ